jgi:hypothetical protein
MNIDNITILLSVITVLLTFISIILMPLFKFAWNMEKRLLILEVKEKLEKE